MVLINNFNSMNMKKKLFSSLFTLLAVAISLIGCKKDRDFVESDVTAVENLHLPANGSKLFVDGQGTAKFEWEAARAQDNGVVLYEVLFDKEDGDFSKPIYSLTSDGRGLYSRVSIPYSDMNAIANSAGIKAGQAGNLKWTVRSSRGLNFKNSSISNVLEVRRPEGFSVPGQAYLTGSATENGDELAKAVSFKKLKDQTFEIYTSLKAGEAKIVVDNKGTPTAYSINENGKLVEGGATKINNGPAVYRIRVNFATANVEMVEVVSVNLWFAPFETLSAIPYAGDGVWEAKDMVVNFKKESWGSDERYKFKFVLKKQDGKLSDEWFGSTKGDNDRPVANTPSSFWHMVPVSNDRWSNSFKFATEVDGKKNDIRIIFNTSVPEYTHKVTIK